MKSVWTVTVKRNVEEADDADDEDSRKPVILPTFDSKEKAQEQKLAIRREEAEMLAKTIVLDSLRIEVVSRSPNGNNNSNSGGSNESKSNESSSSTRVGNKKRKHRHESSSDEEEESDESSSEEESGGESDASTSDGERSERGERSSQKHKKWAKPQDWLELNTNGELDQKCATGFRLKNLELGSGACWTSATPRGCSFESCRMLAMCAATHTQPTAADMLDLIVRHEQLLEEGRFLVQISISQQPFNQVLSLSNLGSGA
jgi:hypothetical protein